MEVMESWYYGLLAQISTLEAISALLLLFTAFYFIFKPIVIQRQLANSKLAIIGKDLLLS